MLDYLIMYEYKARELENDCLIKAELERRGYKVELINIYDYRRISHLTYNKPKVIVVPYLYSNQELCYNIYARVGKINKIVNLQWEQILSKKWAGIGAQIPKDDARYATHLCWGKVSKNRLKNAGVNNAVTSGPIHMDFLRESFHSYYKTKEQLASEFGFDKNKKLVLYISSFTMTKMTIREVKEMENIVTCGVNDIRDIMTISKKETMKWIENLLIDRKDIVFIYRPHPAEKSDPALELLQNKYGNFKVIADYSVKQWILVSDRIFTWISTSIAEVYFAKKNCSILRSVEVPEDLDAEININAKFTDNYDKMRSFLDKTDNEFPITDEVIDQYYSFDKTPAYIRICNLLEKVLKTGKYDMKIKTQNVNIYQIIKNVIFDEIIKRFNLLNKADRIAYNNLYDRINVIKIERKRVEKDMVSQKEINYLTNKIKKLIS